MASSEQTMMDKQGSAAYVEQLPVEAESLTPSHKEYLLERHHTLDLEPLPSSDPNDPLNWPTWKKNLFLGLITFHAMMSTFGAAAPVPAFEDLSKMYHKTIPQISYLVSVQILFNGVAPLVWRPIADRYGRRPVVLVSTLVSSICNIGGGFCHSYGTQMVTRVLAAIAISPTAGIGSAVATELFFAHERARRIGWWTLTVSVGPPLGPLVFGYIVDAIGPETGPLWVFRILAIVNFCQFLAYIALNAESKYPRRSSSMGTEHEATDLSPSIPHSRLQYPRLVKTPFQLRDFYACFTIIRYPDVLATIMPMTAMFAFVNVAIILEIPHVMGHKFELSAGQVGLQCIGPIVGALIGEQVAGPCSDYLVRHHYRRTSVRDYSFRLRLSHLGWAAAIAGLVVFWVRLDQAAPGHWNVTPLIGAAIAWFGGQILMTTLITYAVDCHRDKSSEIGVFANMTRHVWGFVAGFFLPPMFAKLGLAGSGGLMVGIMFVFGWLPTVALHWTARNRVWDK